MSEMLAERYRCIRSASERLIEGLTAEDTQAQSMPDASPLKWHLAHTTWFFETFILERFETGFVAHRDSFRFLFNSYYNGIGDQYPRPNRGLITRPKLDEVIDYRNAIDCRMTLLMQRKNESYGETLSLIELGLQHEQQHQELMMTDLKHLFSLNPEGPVYRPGMEEISIDSNKPSWIHFEGGVTEIGKQGNGFAFDNESPRHRVYLEPYQLASHLVTELEFLDFIEAGGYADPALWLSEGWDWITRNGINRPLYWERDSNYFQVFTLGGWRCLNPNRPIQHLSYFEADAFARFKGARLPTEAEWEHALTSPHADHIRDAFGHVWQWTSSSYGPYPGFREAPGAVGEYNGKFMVNQYVLRGDSLATPLYHSRLTYRNFFPTTARWQFSGLRLAC